MNESFGDFVLGESVEDGGGDDDLEDRGKDQRQHTHDEAVHVFLHGKRDSTQRMSSKLDTSELDDDGEDEDDEEEGVIEEILEDIDFG